MGQVGRREHSFIQQIFLERPEVPDLLALHIQSLALTELPLWRGEASEQALSVRAQDRAAAGTMGAPGPTFPTSSPSLSGGSGPIFVPLDR